jgi:hypothetical protein
LNATRLCELKDFAKEAINYFPYKFLQPDPYRKCIEIVWQDYSSPKELSLDSYGRDVLYKVINEIKNYLKTDVTDLEKTYFTNKIKTFETLSTVTEPIAKQNLKTFLDRNERIFNNVGYFKRLWPELSTLTA